jgi:cytochrome c biogenesis protein
MSIEQGERAGVQANAPELQTGSASPPDGPRDDRGRPEVMLPRLGPIGWLRWIWRQLTSMRTALMLLMLLALASIPGSLLPQNRIDPGQVTAYVSEHPKLSPWIQRVDGFDVYSSAWFSAIYLLLFISLVGCVLPRARQHWKAMRAVPPRAPRRLERMPAHQRLTTDLPAGQVLEAARKALRRRRYRVAVHDEESISAERGHLSETGNLAFHLALLGLLGAVAAGSYLGYSGQSVVIVGDSWSNTLPQYDSFTPGRAVNTEKLPPFSFTLRDFKVAFDDTSTGNQFGAARNFEAYLDYQKKPGAAVEKKTIRVNHPLAVDGARVFLVGNGYAPVITVRDGHGNVAWSGPVPFVASDGNYTSNGVVKVPDALPTPLGLVGVLLPDAAVDSTTGQPISIFPDDRNPRFIFAAYTGDLGVNSGVPSSVYVLDTTKMKQLTAKGQPFSSILAVGQSVTLPDKAGSVTFNGVKRYAALDVRADPTKLYVLFFALTALFGVTVSLFVRRRRVWVRAVTDDEGRTVVEVAGLARTEDAHLDDEISRLLTAAVPPDSQNKEPVPAGDEQLS